MPGYDRRKTPFVIAAVRGLPQDHTVAIKTARQELICGAPKVQSEASVFDVAITLRNNAPISLQILRPVSKRIKIAHPIIVKLFNAHGRAEQFVHKVIESEKGVIAGIDVFHHKR